jgi:enoyl-[acyl-carrier protein] reductase I
VAGMDLTGKNAIVFGVANHRSIGWGIAKALHDRGCRLAISYQSDRFRGAVEKLTEDFEGRILVPCDVLSDEQIDACFATVKQQMGHLDYVVHSIAAARREDLEGNFRDTTRDGYNFALEVSSYSFVAIAHRAVPMMEGRNGALIGLSYLAANRPVPKYNVMGSAKAALEHAIRQLALELGPLGIRANCISAGPVSTLAARGIDGFSGMLRHYKEKAALGRNVTIEEIGDTAVFLLSDMSSAITGEVIYVDCGFHMIGF